MEPDCNICGIAFDTIQRSPMVLCMSQHLCCDTCLKQLFSSNNSRCPECREPLDKNKIKKFRFFQQCLSALVAGKKIEECESTKKQLQSLRRHAIDKDKENSGLKGQSESLKDKLQILTQMLHQKIKQSQQLQKEMQSQKEFSKKLFQDCQEAQKFIQFLKKIIKDIIGMEQFPTKSAGFKACIRDVMRQWKYFQFLSAFFQDLIEKKPDEDEVFIGLGNLHQNEVYGQNRQFQWYQQNYGMADLSFYDLLSLCNMFAPDYQKQNQWYERQLLKNPQNFKAKFGVALVEHNQGHIDVAVIIYEDIIKQVPRFEKPYEMVGLVVSEKRQDMRNMHSCIMGLQPSYFLTEYQFIYNKLYQNRQEFYAAILEMKDKQPNCMESLLSIAVLYFDHDGNQKETLKICQKYLQLNKEDRNDCYLIMAMSYFKGRNYHNVEQILLKINPQSLPIIQRITYFFYYSQVYKQCHLFIDDWKESNEFLELAHNYLNCWPSGAQCRIIMRDVYNELKQYKQLLVDYYSLLRKEEISNNLQLLALCHICVKRYNDTIKYLRKIQQFQQKSLQIYYLLCSHYSQMGQNYQDSLFYGQKCLNYGYTHNNLVYVKMVKAFSIGSKDKQCVEFVEKHLKQAKLSRKDYRKIHSIYLCAKRRLGDKEKIK